MNRKIKLANLILFLSLTAAGTIYAIPNHSVTETRVVQQTSVCTGVVKDVSGETIIGASVVVKGTTNGTVTGVDGNFQINDVEKGTIIQISFIGYQTVEVVWNGSPLSIVLKDDAQALDEVVVVGYGIQKKVNLTGSVSSVEGEYLNLRPVANATQSLQGMVPGLTVTNGASGRPGAAASFSIRGQGNLANNANPYVLVDGVEMSLSQVNPNDIESISVLKDASACAIYGARAAYGVILVTTKKGTESKMRVSYQGSIGWSSPTVLPEMANSLDFVQFWNLACVNAGASTNSMYSDEKIKLLEQYMQNSNSVDPWADLNGQNNLVAAFENTTKGLGNTDYFKLHYKDFAFKQNHNLSLSGGNKKAQYYVSGGFYSEDGILRYADIGYDRFNFNTNITSEMIDWLKMKINVKYMHSNTDTPFGTGGLSEGFYHSLARFRPTVSPVDPNGHFTELSLIPYLQSGTFTNDQADDMSLTGGFEVKPIKNWKIFLDYTYKQHNVNYKAMNVAPMIPGADNETLYAGTRGEMGVLAGGSYTRAMSITRYQSVNLYTDYQFSLDKHNFVVLAGFQEEDNNYNYMYSQINDLISSTDSGLNLGTGDRNMSETRNGWATRGFFGRINYDYDSRYLLEVNGRYDGSSRFASDHRWGFFPSVSLGWNISRERFFGPLSDVVSNLKLRASWGLLGNQTGAGLYTFASTMGITTMGNWYFGNGRDMYINAPGVIDSNTTWEKVESKNIGLDFGFLGNSLTGTFEIFQRDTKDMLGPSADLADFFGAGVPNTNNACMRNKGWELALNYKGKIGTDIDYSIGGSVSDAVSEVTAYENPTGTNPAGAWYVGKKVGEIWGYRADGLLQTSGEAEEYNKTYDLSYLSGQTWTPGDVKYLDLDGNNRIDKGNNTLDDMGDLTIIGNSTPRYQYTVNGNISWKGLSLSLMFQGVGKRDWAPNGVYFWASSSFAQVTVFKEHLDYWTEDNPGAYYPKPYTNSAGAVGPYINKTQQTCDRYLQNAAYCRLKNLTLSYDLPKEWVNKVGLSKAQVFFSGDNLLTFTKLAGMFDPEAIFTSNGYTGEGGKNYPMNRVLSVGVILNL